MGSVLGCTIISMENYRNGVDEAHDSDSIDFETLIQNLDASLFYISSGYCKHIEAESTDLTRVYGDTGFD